MRLLLFVTIAALLTSSTVAAVEQVTYRRDGRQATIRGRLEVEAHDGGLLLLSEDGGLHDVQPEEIVKRSQNDTPFSPLDKSQLGEQLLRELPDGFKTHATAHYLICYDTSQAYAEWCGALFERLYRGFTNFWPRKGFALRDPEFPLVAIVFADQATYLQYARQDLGSAAESVIAYYNLKNNRIAMYDLTGIESLRLPGSTRTSAAQINRMLAQPQAEATVATIVHEATHQIAFNSGLQRRLADVPLWVSEGLAMYFETPDLQSSKGWRNIGAVNRPRLTHFRENLASRDEAAIRSIVADDNRLRDPRHALDAYAEAWAINFYLLRQRPREYTAYLKRLSEKPPLTYDTAEVRLQEFREAFGDDLSRFDSELLRNLRKVK